MTKSATCNNDLSGISFFYGIGKPKEQERNLMVSDTYECWRPIDTLAAFKVKGGKEGKDIRKKPGCWLLTQNTKISSMTSLYPIDNP